MKGGNINMAYKDYSFNKNSYGSNEEVSGDNALIFAIKNILLSREGNYPFDPLFGMNIEKYQFELLDDVTINNIKSELTENLYEYLPSLDNISINIKKVESDGKFYLGISIATTLNQDLKTSNFLLYNNEGIVDVINETF
jgi:phage baseplate assembly protein W